jgi:hypothetical protein
MLCVDLPLQSLAHQRKIQIVYCFFSSLHVRCMPTFPSCAHNSTGLRMVDMYSISYSSTTVAYAFCTILESRRAKMKSAWPRPSFE